MQLAALYFINKKENIMAKINIYFNNSKFEIDASSFSDIKNYLVSHLGTIAGEGLKIVIDGVEYSVDPNKLADASASLEATLNNLNSSDTPDDNERLEGDGAEYYTLAPTALSFRSTAPLNELQEIQINGVTVDPSNYTLEEGSTIVTFPIDYLKTLNVGNYEVAVASESKTVKGDFTVKAPDLNNHGFYYNQPYSANLPMFGGDTALFVREDGTYDIITVGKFPDTGDYTLEGDTIVATHPLLGTIHCTISSDGQSIYCTEVGATFELSGSTAIAADDDYVYVYYEDLGGYEVTAIDKTKAEYGAIKTGINGIDTVKLGNQMFYACSNLTNVTIPNSVLHIGTYTFYGCRNLVDIIFAGTVEQWNTVTITDVNWKTFVPATHVHCIDGDVAL